MNTPTPAQALAKTLALCEKAVPPPWSVCYEPKNDYWHKGLTIGAASASDARRVCDVFSLLDEAEPDTIQDYNGRLIVSAVNLVAEHGQHFAGLESKLQEWIDTADGLAAEVKRLRGSVSGWKSRCEQWQEAAEAAEARCAELEEIVASQAATVAAAYDAATKVEAAETRVREAEGLLREVKEDGNAYLQPRIAAFLAARG